MIDVVEIVRSKGTGEWNEDNGGFTQTAAWVIDGSTDLEPSALPHGESGAHWISQQVNAMLLSSGAEGAPIAFEELADRIALAINSNDAFQNFLPPACAISRMALAGGSVTIESVGDVATYIPSRDELVLDNSFAINESIGLREDSESSRLAGIRSRRIGYLQGRKGSWILSNNPSVKLGVKTRTFGANELAEGFLMFTDGFRRIVDTYKLYDSWASVWERVRGETSGLRELHAELRRFEMVSDPRSHFKSSDDIFVLHGKVSAQK